MSNTNVELFDPAPIRGQDSEPIHSLVFDGLNQARVIVSPTREVDALRDWPHAQKVIRRWPQQLDAGFSG
jgi:hypothetical protein